MLDRVTLLDQFVQTNQCSLYFWRHLSQIAETQRVLLAQQPAVEWYRTWQIQL